MPSTGTTPQPPAVADTEETEPSEVGSGSSGETFQIEPDMHWKSQARMLMAENGLYQKHSLDHPLLKDFTTYLEKDLQNEHFKQEVENVARFLHFMDPQHPSLLFVRNREKSKLYLAEAKLTKQTPLNHLKSLKRALLEQVEHWQSFLALVNMIMFCTGIPGHYPVNETTSSLTLTFWYTLQDDIMSFEAERQQVYLQVYRPVYFQLVDVLLHKAQFPSDEEYASWSSDEKEQFRIYRVDISDTLMYVYEMLGAELLSNLYDKLGRLLTNTEQTSSWQHTEALLYGFQSIAETIDVNYSDVIPGLIGLIPRININNVQLADTVMFTIGGYVNTLLKLVPQVLRLQEQLRDAIQNGDMETSHGICRIAVSLGENHSRYTDKRYVLCIPEKNLLKTVLKNVLKIDLR
ncbi:hypothetical protein IRJ41_009688 [Triplophysa rosa]|uniref:Uncharacterized protein n=1 Tax=Triplophysa rosa TaxID=992332 RepID=A0A9W7T3S5_TRIRA|nr:hypothetical protein IRJ41_009688 [Triplophysa rosa]